MIPQSPFESAKDYKGHWGVFDKHTSVWYYPPSGTKDGRKWCEAKAKELNDHMRNSLAKRASLMQRLGETT